MPAAKGPPQKEATVFILDSFPTMNEPHPVVKKEGASSANAEDCPTRIDCAKRALEGMLFDMIINAYGGSMAAVIVCKTKETENHLVPKDLGEDEDLEGFPYANLTELRHKALKHDPDGANCMRRPDLALIREMWNVKPVKSMKKALKMKGDICDAICLAADCLHSMTNKKAFRRKIVLLTDAQHPIVLDMTQMLHIIDALRSMGETPIHVLGLGFGGNIHEYKIPLDASAAIKQEDISPRKRVKVEDGVADENNEDEPIPDQPPSSSNDINEPIFYNTLQDREKLLASLTEKTGGSVVPIATMQELLDAKAGKRIRKASPRFSQFHVGPGMTIGVKTFKLLDQEAMPKIIQRVVSLEADGTPRQNEETGEEITEPVIKDYAFYLVKENNNNAADSGGGDAIEEKAEPEDIDKLESIDKDDLIDAVKYGKDLIPYGAMEKAGLKFEHDCGYDDETLDVGKQHIHILGYVSRDEIPDRFMVGPAYGMSGGGSRKACILLAAMAQSLEKANCVAVCSATFSSGGSSSLACLLPFDEPNRKVRPPNRLVLFKLPFEGDIKLMGKPSFDEILETDNDGDEDSSDNEEEKASSGKPKKSQICDDLVDSLMLPDDALRSEKIASPYHTSFNQTMLNRAVRETEGSDLVAVREDPNHIMRVPPEVLEHSKPVIDQFRKAFPLRKKKVFKTKRGGKATTYTEFLGEEN